MGAPELTPALLMRSVGGQASPPWVSTFLVLRPSTLLSTQTHRYSWGLGMFLDEQITHTLRELRAAQQETLKLQDKVQCGDVSSATFSQITQTDCRIAELLRDLDTLFEQRKEQLPDQVRLDH